MTVGRVRIFDLEFDALREREVVAGIVAEGAGGGWVCPVNLDVLRQIAASPQIRELVDRADLVVADGMPLIWASRIQGTPLPERVAGSSLILSLPAAAAAAGRSVFLLGGNPGAAEAAAARLRELDPDLRVAGTLCPPMGFERDPAMMQEIKDALTRSQPDIVFVGLGFPKQERLIAWLRTELSTAWFVSCGISFSFVSGEVLRAPRALQRLGLEWVHRLAQEPKRLFRRYIVDGPPFLARVLLHAGRRRLSRAACSP